MKQPRIPNERKLHWPIPAFKHAMILLATILGTTTLVGDTVIVTARDSTGAVRLFPPYLEDTSSGGFFSSSGNSTAPGVPAFGTRFGSSGFPAVTWKPTLAGTGHVYLVECTLPTSDLIPSDIATELSVVGGDLSTNKTDAFGGPQNAWNFVCFLTNAPGVNEPELTLTYSDTLMDGVTLQAPCSFSRRWYTGPLRFTDVTDLCVNVPAIAQVHGPLAAGQTNVFVPNVASNATAVTVYADDVQIGTLTSGVVEGVNSVPTSPLVKGQVIKATQTVGGQESCLQPNGPPVGGGANPQIRVSLSVRQEATAAGPIGADGGTNSLDHYFIGATAPSGGFGTAPLDGQVITPGTNWQTVTFQNGVDSGYIWTGAGTYPDPNPFGVLDAIAFCIEDLTDSGPFNVYIDNLMNGTNLIQGFESATNGEPTVLFSAPRNAGNTLGSLLGAPNVSQVTTDTADTGSKSARVSWQFSDTINTFWVRVMMQGSGTPNPMVDLSQPISFRILLLPVGVTVTPPPTPGPISITRDGSNVILDWSGSFTLQSAPAVTGTYTDVAGPVTTGPYTNAIGAGEQYFRLRTSSP